MSQTSAADFERLLIACHDISGMFPQGIVYIGGIAVYLHAINAETAKPFAEFTHDADLYISMAEMSDLRDIEEVTQNSRLSKHQLIKDGFEFDIYTERHAALPVAYDAVIAHAVKYDGLQVACLEHLFVLKLNAYKDRHKSAKGQKDAKDLVRIALVAEAAGEGSFRSEMAAAYLGDADIAFLQRVEKGPEIHAMAKGNSFAAKKLRQAFSRIVAEQIRFNDDAAK